MELISVAEQVAKPLAGRPHLVILGAGASRAAFPNGDRNGRRLPLMLDFTETLGLDSVLQAHGVTEKIADFELLYSQLAGNCRHDGLRARLEAAVEDYFWSLRLPDEPTLYDYLLLCLCEKDVIATFNWDPLLFQAALRNWQLAPLPRMLFLHGNVAIGYCAEDHVKGPAAGRCATCGRPFVRTRLLYPVTDKNYAADPFLLAEWKGFEEALESAYLFTIFGFGAPATDAKAVEIMQTAWRRPGNRELEEIELIDIRPDDELHQRWEPFIVRTHYRIYPGFFDSTIFEYPRRSCEAIWNQFMMLRLSAENRPPRDIALAELQDWFKPLVDAEASRGTS